MIVDPFSTPGAWTVVYLAGQPTPGLAELTDADRPFGWDVKQGKGADGATVTNTGRGLAKPKLKLLLWTAAHFAAYDALLPSLKYEPTKGQPVRALDIYHPALAANDISSVVVHKLGGIVHKGGGLFEVVIELLEYRPPPPKRAVATPTQSDGDGTGPDGSDPELDSLHKQIAPLLSKVQQAYAP